MAVAADDLKADDLNGLWRFSDVQPTFREYVQDRLRGRYEYDPAHPLYGLHDIDLDGKEEISAGDMVKNAFVYMNASYSRQTHVVDDFHVSQPSVSAWYNGHFTEDMLFNTIFPALCSAYVAAFCEQGTFGFALGNDGYAQPIYHLKHAKSVPLTEDFLYSEEGPLEVVDIELRTLSILLEGEEDPHIYKNTTNPYSTALPKSEDRYYRAIIRLASSALSGHLLERYAGVAEDYLRLELFGLKTDYEQLPFLGKPRALEMLERCGVTEHLMQTNGGCGPDIASNDEWAETFEQAAADLADDNDLIRIREKVELAAKRHVEQYRGTGEELWRSAEEAENTQQGTGE